MRILGIDYGEKKIGLAFADGPLAEPLGVVKVSSIKYQVLSICQKEKVEKIVVGISEGKMVEKQRNFGKMVGEVTGLPIEYYDETLTSKEAIAKMREIGKRLKAEDAISAALILQSYLDKGEKNV